jgi:hypothetical protein
MKFRILFWCASMTQSVTISSNFGPSGTFNPSIGWGVVGPTQLAYPFTVPGNANYAFESASLALSRGIGPNNSFTASLATDAGGVPGSILETFPVFALQSYPNDTVPVTVTSSLQPLLKSGSVYWLIISATFSGNGVNWLTANVLTTPDLQATQSSPTSTWVSSPLLYGYNNPGAFSVGGVSLIPQLTNPSNSATGVSQTPTLTWNASIAATSYDVYLGTSSPPAFTGTTTNTSYAPPRLLPNQTYYWQIVANDSLGMNPSAVWPFTTVDPSCSYSVSPILIGFAGGPASLNVTAGPACYWTGSTAAAWLTIPSGSGTGNGAIPLNAAANNGTARLASIAFVNQTVGVMQGGSPTVQIFDDVSSGDPYFDYVSLMSNYGITVGCQTSPPLYCPSEAVTRAEMAVFIVRGLNLATNTSLTYPPTAYFQDVPPSGITDSEYFPYVQRLAQLGITVGCQTSPALFCPDESIPQAQMAVFVIRAWMLANNIPTLTYPTTPYFTDVAATDEYFPYIQKMAQLGFWTGCGGGQYCENSAVTRDQMAPMIMRGMLGAP